MTQVRQPFGHACSVRAEEIRLMSYLGYLGIIEEKWEFSTLGIKFEESKTSTIISTCNTYVHLIC